MILKWAGLKGDQFGDVFASKQAHLFPEYWDKRENGLSHNWGLSDSKGRPEQKFLWFHPPHHLLQDSITKIVLDQGRGILLVPVRKQYPWFWTLGEVALDWWDLDSSVPLYRNTDGLILQQSPHWTTRAVLFDAQGMDLRQLPEGKEWGCTDESAAGETDGCHQISSGCRVCHSSHRVSSPPLFVREARLRVLRQDTAAHSLISERSLRAVVEGDRIDPRFVPYRKMLVETFSTVFEFAKNILTDVDHFKRGEAGIAQIKLEQGGIPQRIGPYRTVGVRDAAFRKLISKISERGVLEKSFSSSAARAFCVPKPGGKWRLVIDYRYLNLQIADEAFPLPVIEDLFLEQSKNAIWSISDSEDWFQQMVLEPESRPVTAFATPWGLFQWTVLPMGLETAPQAYQRMVQLCLEERGVKPCIDDVLRGTPDTEDDPDLDAPVTDGCIRQHYEDLCHILTCLQDWQLSIKPCKVFLLLRRVRFCGQILERRWRSADPERIAAVSRSDWQDIRTPTHLKAFLGLAQWYAFYIDKFAEHAAPLTDALWGLELTKKGKFKSTHPSLSASKRKAVFQQFSSVAEAEKEICCLENRIYWTPEMIWHFGQLKEKLLNAVQLYILDTQRQFWIHTDASEFAVGGMPEQRRCKCAEADDPTQGCGCFLFPVAFFSRKLQGDKSHGQRAWPVRDKETYAIVATPHKFHAWLQQSALFLKSAWVATDHRSLEYMTKEDFVTVSGPVGRRGRWHQLLSQFLVDVVYAPRQNQEIPDTLSRWSYPAYLYSPETNIHGTEEDAAGVAADEGE